MSLFDFILSLLLVFNPGISEADFDNVYQLLDDTTVHSVIVADSAFDRLSQLADSGVSSLDLTTEQASNLRDIMEALYQSGRPTGTSLFDITQSILGYLGYGMSGSVKQSFADLQVVIGVGNSALAALDKNLSSIESMLHPSALEYYPRDMMRLVAEIKDKLAASSGNGGWDTPLEGWLTVPGSMSSQFTMTPFQSLMDFRSEFMSYGSISQGLAYLNYDGNVILSPGVISFSYLLSNGFSGMANILKITAGDPMLSFDGSIVQSDFNYSIGTVMNRGFNGLAQRLSAADRTTAFTFLAEDIMQGSETVEVDNILDALGIMGTQLQNPLQRLAYVFANPQDLEIRKDVSENVDQAQEDFFKPDGQGSVKPSQIGDAAGISGGAAGALASPGSVGDLTSQINNGDNFSFFSQTTLGNLDNVPVAYSADDDFIDFYDPSNSPLWEALK